ncbi:hypothetical protein FQU96_31810 [Reyranella sp. CPCC 100927]|nr:hypothetical protein FQU96_31810 [Reyranella sp. CPCC 100927]
MTRAKPEDLSGAASTSLCGVSMVMPTKSAGLASATGSSAMVARCRRVPHAGFAASRRNAASPSTGPGISIRNTYCGPAVSISRPSSAIETIAGEPQRCRGELRDDDRRQDAGRNGGQGGNLIMAFE